MRRQGGFTIIEILISLLVMAVGILGIMAMQTAAVRGNQLGRRLDRAYELCQEIIELERARSYALGPPVPSLLGTVTAPADVTLDGVTYHRQLTTTIVARRPNLVRMRADVWFGPDGNASALAVRAGNATQFALRTLPEAL